MYFYGAGKYRNDADDPPQPSFTALMVALAATLESAIGLGLMPRSRLCVR